jgi:hypothetical protein
MTENRPLVIVGADGSPSAEQALTWANDYATLSGADVEIVTTWQFPTTYGVGMPLAGWDPEAEAVKISEKHAPRCRCPTTACTPVSSKVLPPRYSCTGAGAPTCSWSAPEGTEASPACSWDR